jgi:hypothetical protein
MKSLSTLMHRQMGKACRQARAGRTLRAAHRQANPPGKGLTANAGAIGA